MWRSTEPYNTLPALPPQEDVETKAILRQTISARSALANLNQAAKRIQNPAVLLHSFSLLEAQASSEIENIVTTTDDLFRHAETLTASASPETKETLRYKEALFAGVDSIRERPLSVTTAVQVCSKILLRQMGVRNTPGTYIGNPQTRETIYTPPVGENLIREKLGNWEKFLHTPGEIDPLIVMAIAHYQFEAIHPFSDGNGRTGRIINVLQLVESGLLEVPILYLSRFMIQNRTEYYNLLLGVTEEAAWEKWILFLLRGVAETAENTLAKIDKIQELANILRDKIKEYTTAGSNLDFLDLLVENPYLRINTVMRRCGVSRPTATSWLTALHKNMLLKTMKIGRERLFINDQLMDILIDNNHVL